MNFRSNLVNHPEVICLAILCLLIRRTDPDSADKMVTIFTLAKSYRYSKFIDQAARLPLDSEANLNRSNKEGKTVTDGRNETFKRRRNLPAAYQQQKSRNSE